MKEVVNTTSEEVAAYFNGGNIYFKAGEKKSFEDGVALEIVRENDGLSFEEEVKAIEEVAETPVKEKKKEKK